MLCSLENCRMMNFGSLWRKLVYYILISIPDRFDISWFIVCVLLCILRAALDDIPSNIWSFSKHSLLDILTIFYVTSARCLLGYVCSFSPLNPVPLQCSPLSIISLLHLSSSPPSRWLARLAARSVRLDLGRDVVDFGEALCTSRTDWVWSLIRLSFAPFYTWPSGCIFGPDCGEKEEELLAWPVLCCLAQRSSVSADR